MANCGSPLKTALVAIILVAVAVSGQADEKLASCCTQVTNVEITEPILGYLVQRANLPCVKAVIFQTETGLYCCQVNAPWVRRKIMEFRSAMAQSTVPSAITSSPVSLLSVITSTSSLPSSSTLLSSSSSNSPPTTNSE